MLLTWVMKIDNARVSKLVSIVPTHVYIDLMSSPALLYSYPISHGACFYKTSVNFTVEKKAV